MENNRLSAAGVKSAMLPSVNVNADFQNSGTGRPVNTLPIPDSCQTAPPGGARQAELGVPRQLGHHLEPGVSRQFPRYSISFSSTFRFPTPPRAPT